MKTKLYFIIILTSLQCCSKFESRNFKGGWLAFENDTIGNIISLPQINFKNDSIFFTDTYGYIEKGIFSIKNNQITVTTNKTTFTKSFNFSSKDSILNIDNTTYSYWPGYTHENFKYDLIGIKTKTSFSSKNIITSKTGFHLIKNKNNEICLKLNEKIVSNIDEIIPFVYHSNCLGIKNSINPNLIYLGKKVTLNDFLQCYYRLAQINQLKVLLITDFDIKTNTYNGVYDNIRIWNSQLTKFNQLKNSPPSPTTSQNDKEIYIKKFSPELISIETTSAINKIATINSSTNYLITINNNVISLKEYINLKQKVIELRKKYKTKIVIEFKHLPI